MQPNTEQQLAIEAMLKHLRTVDNQPFLVVKGPAGTGKTFTTQFVIRDFKRPVVFTAPTNKAVRVLREALTSDSYKPYCRTIYSLLGLQMQANGEVKELARPEDPVDLNEFAAIWIDEGGMLGQGKDGKMGIWKYVLEAAQKHPKVRWIIMGDPYQLPPVGEDVSPVWQLPNILTLDKVMRQDNQILTLATHLRDMIDKPFGRLTLQSDNDGEEGVWKTDRFEQAILNHADTFLKGTESKAIAWRNATVDRLNAMIRKELFADSLVCPWQPGDRITLLEPAKNFEGDLIGTTDEEGAVEKADVADHPFEGMKCWRIVMRSDLNTSMTLWVLHNIDKNRYELRKARLAAEARNDRSKWKDFWSFVESFHNVRHAYAITAHRAQGSTYKRAFVNWKDILVNPNVVEARRCLYVAATRPKKELYLG